MEKLGDIHKALELPPPEKACPKYLNPPNSIFAILNSGGVRVEEDAISPPKAVILKPTSEKSP